MKRRKFLKMTGTGLSSALLAYTDWFQGQAIAQTHSDAIVWEAQGEVSRSIPALFNAMGGLEKLVPTRLAQSTIIIKPNLCLPHPTGRGTTTSPGVVEALCSFLIEKGAKKIIITDHTLQEDAGRSNGFEIAQIGDKFPEVKFVLANQQRLFQPAQVNGKVLKQTEVLKMLERADLLINLATAKHHSATQVSLSLKNLMGLIWDRTAFHTQFDLHQAIADLALLIKPGLNIIDATRVLLNGGPTGPGPISEENRLFASFDPVALDSVVVSRYNFGGRLLSASEVQHLVAAHKNGIGEIDFNKIQIQKIV
jgi:uncharacterized protein (DUF362 family)